MRHELNENYLKPLENGRLCASIIFANTQQEEMLTWFYNPQNNFLKKKRSKTQDNENTKMKMESNHFVITLSKVLLKNYLSKLGQSFFPSFAILF